MMIEVKNLFFSYGKRKQKVFDDFSLALDKGSVYGLLGKNGTGIYFALFNDRFASSSGRTGALQRGGCFHALSPDFAGHVSSA